jgi:hypothetical protein
VTVSRIALQGADAAHYKVAPSNLTLGAKATRTVTVTFAPTNAGAKAATVALTVGTAAPVTVALQGKAVEAPAIRLSVTSLSFDDTEAGTTSQQTFTVSNAGSSPVTISGIALKGDDASEFRVNPSRLTLSAKANRTVTVTFAPTSAGPRTASVEVRSGAGAPAIVTLQGLAYEPEPEEPEAGGEADPAWEQAFGAIAQIMAQAPAGGTVDGTDSGKATVKVSVGLSGITYTITFDHFSNDGLIWITGTLRIRPLTADLNTLAYTGTLELSGESTSTIEIDVRVGPEEVTGTVKIDGEEIPISKPVAMARTWSELPSAPQLQPNYPNPFNSTTLIPYYLTAPEQIRLTVYNLLGQQVRVLVDQVEGQGWHQAAWDGRDDQDRAVTTGVYVYQLRLGNAVQQRSLMLLR